MQQINYGLDLASGLFESMRMPLSYRQMLATATVALVVISISVVIYYIFSRVIARAIHLMVTKTSVTWDDTLLNPRLVKVFSELMLVISLRLLLPEAFDYYPGWQKWITPLLDIMVVAMSASLVNQIILAVYNIICDETRLPAQSLKGIRQMLSLLVLTVAAIIIISILINKSPAIILSGLGASAAVLMLVFKDSILGLVAGVQLTANDMLKPGDWITAPKYGANGTVLEVTLTTVKVQNFDMTIVTIPPYSLVSEAFQNWRGMQQSPGRRICRSLCIDANSVAFLSPEQMQAYAGEGWAAGLDLSRKTVNLTLFRKYLEYHIMHLEVCAKSMTAMVRELQPTPQGIPVEIYFFSSVQEWVSYEHIQADLIDHVVASLQDFNLRIYQQPSGLDVASLRAV